MVYYYYLNDHAHDDFVRLRRCGLCAAHRQEAHYGGCFPTFEDFAPHRAVWRGAANAVVLVDDGDRLSAAAGAGLSAAHPRLHLEPAALRRPALRLPARHTAR